jgi:three-Cys-motif partner protein
VRQLEALPDDGLITPVVGDWADEKYRLFWYYADLFAASMKNKWEHRVYLDLFAGPGRARIRGQKRIIPAPPLLALNVKAPFTRYIYSEYNEQKLAALEERVRREAPDADTHFILGDTNANIQKIIDLVPQQRTLAFCFADPYRLADLPISTLQKLAYARRIDFLVLVPSGMDASRNRKIYIKAKSRVLDDFLGTSDWRNRWSDKIGSRTRFSEFVVDEFGESMSSLGYQYGGISTAHLMTSTKRHLPLYHLLMLSKHPLGANFWEKARAGINPQKSLF